VGGAVVDDDLDAGHRKFHLGALGQTAAEALFTGGDELGRDGAAGDLVFENELLVGHRLHIAGHPAVLAGAAGLFFVRVVEFGPLGDGFAVGHPRLSGGRLRPCIRAHAFDIDIQVQLAHALDDGIVGFLADVMGPEGGVLLVKRSGLWTC
jgi:hypothetical protein